MTETARAIMIGSECDPGPDVDAWLTRLMSRYGAKGHTWPTWREFDPQAWQRHHAATDKADVFAEWFVAALRAARPSWAARATASDGGGVLRILDVGAGDGSLLGLLADRLRRQLDLARVEVEGVEPHFPPPERVPPGVTITGWHREPIEEWLGREQDGGNTGRFDLILCSHVLYYVVPSLESVTRGLLGLLRQDGELVCMLASVSGAAYAGYERLVSDLASRGAPHWRLLMGEDFAAFLVERQVIHRRYALTARLRLRGSVREKAEALSVLYGCSGDDLRELCSDAATVLPHLFAGGDSEAVDLPLSEAIFRIPARALDGWGDAVRRSCRRNYGRRAREYARSEDSTEVRTLYGSLLARLGGAHGKRVLDLGAGPGILAEAALDTGAEAVVAVEREPEMLEVCKERLAGDGRCELVCADVDDPSFSSRLRGRRFDIVVLGYVLRYSTAPWNLIRKARDLLTPEGVVLVLDAHDLRDRLVAGEGLAVHGGLVEEAWRGGFTSVEHHFTMDELLGWAQECGLAPLWLLRLGSARKTDLFDGALTPLTRWLPQSYAVALARGG